MEPNVQARFAARAKIIKAMGHPTRLFIVDTLSRGEANVQELTKAIGADMSTVSRHLGLLKEVGIIRSERRGSQVYYRLQIPCVLNFFDCVESVIKLTAEEQLKLAE